MKANFNKIFIEHFPSNEKVNPSFKRTYTYLCINLHIHNKKGNSCAQVSCIDMVMMRLQYEVAEKFNVCGFHNFSFMLR